MITTNAVRALEKRLGATPAALRILAAVAIVISVYSGLGDIVRRPALSLLHTDFQAFYCGAAVAEANGDPYAFTPLERCQAHRLPPLGVTDPAPETIDPVPLPGYDIAFFMPFTQIAFRPAAFVWDALLAVAVVATALLLGRLCGLAPLVVGAALCFADGVTSIAFGQIPPLLTFGIVLCGYGLVRERRTPALLGAALAMLEPHVGLPVCCALFVWRPALRPGILLLIVVLAAGSMAALGVPVSIEYLRVELPAHAAAEATTAIQYSLSWLLHYFGVADAAAIRIGLLQYVLFAAIGVAFADSVARRLRSRAALAFFPAAAVLVGGTFIHLGQMTAAIPFALLLATRLRGAAAAAAWTATTLLAVPWPAESRLATIGAVAIVATLVLTARQGSKRGTALWTALAAALLYIAIAGPIMERVVPALPNRLMTAAPPMPRALDGDLLASEEDGRELRGDPAYASATPRTLAAKLPTWFALLIIVGLALAPSRRPETVPQARKYPNLGVAT